MGSQYCGSLSIIGDLCRIRLGLYIRPSKTFKEIRKAKAVFVGTPVYVDENDLGQVRSIQNYRKGLSVVEVKKSWKGGKSNRIAVET